MPSPERAEEMRHALACFHEIGQKMLIGLLEDWSGADAGITDGEPWFGNATARIFLTPEQINDFLDWWIKRTT